MGDAGKWTEFILPTNVKLLKAIAKVTLCHNQLDEVLKYTIKSLADVTIEVAMEATSYTGSKELRDRVKKLARQRLGEGAPLLKLQSLMERSAQATQLRNDLVHNVWSRDAAGGKPRVRAGSQFKKPPTAKQLTDLADLLVALALELNGARRQGWLDEALKKKKPI